MAERRMLSRAVSKSRKLSCVSLKSALLWTWLQPFLDDYGCYEAMPDTIKHEVVPYRKDFTEAIIARCLAELDNIGLIKTYTVDGYVYLEVQRFEDFQTFKNDRPRKAEYPEPPWGYTLGKSSESNGIQRNPKPSKCPTQEEDEVEVEEEVEGKRKKEGRPAAAAYKEFPHIPDSIYQAIVDSWGVLTPSSELMRKIGGEIQNGFPEEWMVKAIIEAGDHGARNWAYLSRIIANWRDNGGPQNGKTKEQLEAERARKDRKARYAQWEAEKRAKEEAKRRQAELEADPEYQRIAALRLAIVKKMQKAMRQRMAGEITPDECQAIIDGLKAESDALPPLPTLEEVRK